MMLEVGAGCSGKGEWLGSVFSHSEDGQKLVSKFSIFLCDTLQLLLHECKPIVSKLDGLYDSRHIIP